VRNRSAQIVGWGTYVPERVLTNADLERMVETSDEWITVRSGIKERRIAGEGESTSTMGIRAAEKALCRAGLKGSDIDLVISASATPDYLFPATGCIIQDAIGAKCGAFDLEAGCSSFVYGLVVGSQMIAAGIIPDFRAPNSIRLGLSPLTTTFDEVHRAIDRIADLAANQP